jgi:hypothetical protein
MSNENNAICTLVESSIISVSHTYDAVANARESNYQHYIHAEKKKKKLTIYHYFHKFIILRRFYWEKVTYFVLY